MASSGRVIIVSGLPCSGKTTIARHLAHKLNLPLICRDDLKATIATALGWKGFNWSQKLSTASYRLLEGIIETELRAARSIIIESNFRRAYDAQKFNNWKQRYGADFFQIICEADREILLSRYRQRAARGEINYLDASTPEEFQKLLRPNFYSSLAINCETLTINTADFYRIKYDPITQQVSSFLDNKQPIKLVSLLRLSR